MIIRRAESADIPQILQLLRQVNLIHHEGRPDIFNLGTKYTEAQLEEIIRARPVLVAETEGYVAGYAFCEFQEHVGDGMLADIKTLYLDDLCVDEGYRGRGIGKALYGAALQLAKDSGCHNLTLNVWSLNEGAVEFYKKCGMQPLKICMEKIID